MSRIRSCGHSTKTDAHNELEHYAVAAGRYQCMSFDDIHDGFPDWSANLFIVILTPCVVSALRVMDRSTRLPAGVHFLD